MIRQERAARAYAGRGWVPLPLNWVLPNGACSCPRGVECGNPGKHPRVKWKDRDAVTDAELGQWWRWWPLAGVGIKTGAVSGVVVVDVDPRHGGDKTLAALEEMHGALPATLTARTGGGGLHILFRHPGYRVQNVQNDETRKLGAGLDVRGDGGQIAAAPTIHASGRSYTWVDWTAEPADLPDWMADRLKAPPLPVVSTKPVQVTARLSGYVRAAIDGELRRIANTPVGVGQRNAELFLASCRLGSLVGAGVLNAETAAQHLEQAALAKAIPHGEARATILSGLRTGARNPRRIAS